MKLKVFLNPIQPKDSAVEAEKQRQASAVLSYYISIIFPTELSQDLDRSEIAFAQDENDHAVATLSLNKGLPNNKYVEDYLPYHIHDDQWLTKFFMTLVKNSKRYAPQITKQITPAQIQKFIETDPKFNAARQAYEIDLTRAQIKFMMTSNYPNELLMQPKYDQKCNAYIIQPFYHPVLSRLKPDPDKTFRQGVITAMKKLNVSQPAIEAALERYADLWRDELMQAAYYNRYMTQNPQDENFIRLKGWYLEAAAQNFKANWLKQRKDAYYREQENAVKQYGHPEALKLSDREAPTVNHIVDELDREFTALTQIVNLNTNTEKSL